VPTTGARVAAGVLAAVLTIGAAGCAGGGRGGTDQPGVEPPAASAGSAERASVATSSEKDVQAALRANDVDDPDRWAQVVYESRPYPAGQAGEQRMRDVLTGNGAGPDVVDGVLRTVSP
jgi:hypothetical protein